MLGDALEKLQKPKFDSLIYKSSTKEQKEVLKEIFTLEDDEITLTNLLKLQDKVMESFKVYE